MKKGSSKKSIYEVNPHTMMISPAPNGDKLYSEILEINTCYTSNFTPFELIKTSCNFFGSSYEGRKDGTKHLIGVTHKPPIIIDPMTFTYAFPTTSPINPNCHWIFPQHIKEYRAININQTYIQFANFDTAVLDMSLMSFNNQMARTSMLHMKFSQKMRKIEMDFPYINMFFPPTSMTAEPRKPYHFNVNKREEGEQE
ncbi:competence protein ComK [Listeria sp. PSOL-1]|uniref:competence protein ComK n=1 Tax=Listeria sp. PSOL-1 TaxID=1844999 RepID=UPI0013D70ACF|nr:competence protein ComK [Listeria sp. PSOL-1]